MKTIQISEELFEELKGLVVDPFDDTPDSVIGRLIQIVKKARSRWSPLEACQTKQDHTSPAKPPEQPEVEEYAEEDDQVVLL